MKQSRPKYSEFVNHIRNPEHKCIASKVTIDLQFSKLLKILEIVISAA